MNVRETPEDAGKTGHRFSEHGDMPDAAARKRSRVLSSCLLLPHPLLPRFAAPLSGSWLQKGISSSISRSWNAGFDDAGPASPAMAHASLQPADFGIPHRQGSRGGRSRELWRSWRGGRLRGWEDWRGDRVHGWGKSPSTPTWHEFSVNATPPSTPSRLAILAPARESSQPASRETDIKE